MRKRLLLAVLTVSLLLVTSADAQADLDRARAAVAEATDAVEEVLADLAETQDRGNELAGRYWQVESGLERLDLDIAASEARAAGLQEQVDRLRLDVKEIAVDQYVNRADALTVGDHESEADRAAAEALARLVVGTNNGAIDQLAVVRAEQDRVVTELTDQRQEQALQLAEVQATQASVTAELERLSGLRAALVEDLDDLQRALDELEAAEAQRQAEEAERAQIAQERERAQAVAAAAAQAARVAPAPTSVPNPQPSESLAEPQAPTTVPNPQPSESLASDSLAEAEATAVPNPQPSEPLASEPTAVPNPQPSEPLASEPTAVPNPEPSEPLGSDSLAEGEPLASEPTAVPNPQPSEPLPEPPAPVAAPSGGGIVCPLAGPFTHTDDFSAPRQVGGVHRANDLISAQGTPVLAVASGTIEHRNSSVGGLSAHLKGDNGDYYFYTHLAGYENEGIGRVSAGMVIGYVGMTGNAPIPHLHFEIHSGGYGNYSNPYGPVRNACF